MHLDRQFHWD